jgi:hypothetical protein
MDLYWQLMEDAADNDNPKALELLGGWFTDVPEGKCVCVCQF